MCILLQVLQEDEKNVKALFRRGQALNGLNKWDEALVGLLQTYFTDLNSNYISLSIVF